MRRDATRVRMPQAQFDQLMTDPDLYQLEDAANHQWRLEYAERRRKNRNFNDHDPIHLAVADGRYDEVLRLLMSGHRYDVVDREGRTPLFYAVLDGEEEIVTVLLDAGANVNVQDHYGETALHFAAREEWPNLAALLLQRGARVDRQDIHGNTPLLRCALDEHGRSRTAQLLVDHGANRHHRNNSGVSPTSVAGRAWEW
ncbi:MAG TPA: ankyrin repeat domain-containing protein [Fimbriimonadaceae bacterium]|nr:ankyrin repeat domain-containing protein [Fimbriimonadaceae bacterium]